MDSRERVICTLNHQEPDKIPWGEHWADYNVYEDILGRKTFVHAKMKETKAWWEGRDREIIESYKKDTIDLVEGLGFDIITVQLFERSSPMRQIDSETYQDENGNIYRVSSVTHDLMPYRPNPEVYTPPTLGSLQQEITKLNSEGVKKPDDWKWELVRHVVKRKKETHFIAVLASDFGFPGFGQIAEEFYLNTALHPEMHAKICELSAKKAMGMLKYYAEEGVDAVIPCADFGSSTGLLANPEIYKEHILPWQKVYCEEAHSLGLKVLKHCCGRIWEILEYLVEAGYDAYEAIQASAGMDVKLLKERVGGKLTLWGGVTNENLIGGSPDDVKADAFYAIKWGAPGGGFIYGASHSLAVGTKRENLLAMKESREKWGTYPLSI